MRGGGRGRARVRRRARRRRARSTVPTVTTSSASAGSARVKRSPRPTAPVRGGATTVRCGRAPARSSSQRPAPVRVEPELVPPIGARARAHQGRARPGRRPGAPSSASTRIEPVRAAPQRRALGRRARPRPRSTRLRDDRAGSRRAEPPGAGARGRAGRRRSPALGRPARPRDRRPGRASRRTSSADPGPAGWTVARRARGRLRSRRARAVPAAVPGSRSARTCCGPRPRPSPSWQRCVVATGRLCDAGHRCPCAVRERVGFARSMTFTERACYGAQGESVSESGAAVTEPTHEYGLREPVAQVSVVSGSGAEERGWERREQGWVNASGRFAGRRVCRCTTSKRARTSSSRLRCSVPTSGASARSRCRGCCASPRSTRFRPTSCSRASSRARSASSTPAARPASRPGFTIDLVRLHELDDPDAQILVAVRDVDPARTPGLQRPHAHDPPFRPARAGVGDGPPHRRARRPARAARPPRRRASDASAGIDSGAGGRARYPAGALATSNTSTSLKILVPGNHLMVGLLGQRDELLRLVEAAFPVQILVRGNEITITGDSADTERVGRLFEEMVVLLEQGHELDRENLGPLDRDAEGRPAAERGAHDRGRARPQDGAAEDGRPEALRRRGARQHRSRSSSARPAPARATSRSRSRCRRCRRRK